MLRGNDREFSEQDSSPGVRVWTGANVNILGHKSKWWKGKETGDAYIIHLFNHES